MYSEIEQFGKWLRPLRESQHITTHRHYTSDLRLFFAWAGKSPAGITIRDVDDYIVYAQEQGYAPDLALTLAPSIIATGGDMARIKSHPHATSLSGYLLIPHELLHLVGYRLVGKRCRYQWGVPYVTPLEPAGRTERLVGLLFPFLVFALLFFICAILSAQAYLQVMLQSQVSFWFVLWTGLALLTGVYAGTAITDLRKAYLLIFKKPWYGWTPFDLFFRPFVDWDKIRQKIASRASDDQSH